MDNHTHKRYHWRAVRVSRRCGVRSRPATSQTRRCQHIFIRGGGGFPSTMLHWCGTVQYQFFHCLHLLFYYSLWGFPWVEVKRGDLKPTATFNGIVHTGKGLSFLLFHQISVRVSNFIFIPCENLNISTPNGLMLTTHSFLYLTFEWIPTPLNAAVHVGSHYTHRSTKNLTFSHIEISWFFIHPQR